MKEIKKTKWLADILWLSLGALCTAAGVYFFKIPNGFSMGGFSGLSVLLGSLVPNIDASTFITVLNLLSLLAGVLFLGVGVGWKTIYCTLFYTLMVNVFGWLRPIEAPLTDEIVLELAFACLLSATGAAIAFRRGGSTGGTDIVALVMRKYTNADISASLLVADGLIVAASFIVFDIRTGLCSVIGLLVKSFLVQAVLNGLNRRKSLLIITSAPREVSAFITEQMHRTATIWHGEGAFTSENRTIILAAMTTYQAAKVRDYAKTVDEHAFITINNTSEIYGKGFLPFGRG